MRLLIPAALMLLSVPAVAAPAGAEGPRERIAEQLQRKGVGDLVNRRCDNLSMVPVWGGIRPVGKNNKAELKAPGMKIDCTGGQVDRVVLKRQFKGDLPKGTTFGMRQKDVWKLLKKGGMKDRSVKGKDADGAFVTLTGKRSSVTWRWADAKGKGAVDRVLIKKK